MTLTMLQPDRICPCWFDSRWRYHGLHQQAIRAIFGRWSHCRRSIRPWRLSHSEPTAIRSGAGSPRKHRPCGLQHSSRHQDSEATPYRSQWTCCIWSLQLWRSLRQQDEDVSSTELTRLMYRHLCNHNFAFSATCFFADSTSSHATSPKGFICTA